MHICITVISGPVPLGPGCVLCPTPSSGFGFPAPSAAPVEAQSFALRHLVLVRVLLGVLSVLVLLWGSLYGHAVECAAAVLAAIFVDAMVGIARAGRER